MHDNLAQELAQLGRLTVGQLRARYTALFGEATRAGNKAWLSKRIASMPLAPGQSLLDACCKGLIKGHR